MLSRIPAERIAELLDTSEDGIVTVDAAQTIVLFTRGAARLFGYEPEEAIGRPLDLLLPARFHAPHRGQVAEFGRGAETSRHMGVRGAVSGRRKDGSEFPAEVSISKSGSGPGVLYTAVVRDVGERRKVEEMSREMVRLRERVRLAEAEAAAHASEQRYRLIVETANEGIWELDADARVVFLNARMAEFLGVPADEVLGRQKWDFVFEEDRPAVQAMFERRRAGAREHADIRFRRSDGQPVWAIMSASPLPDGRGAFRGALDMFSDITDRRRAEDSLRETTRQLWQAARLAGVGELAAGIAHELNNPLGTVALRVEQLLYRTPADDPARRPLEVVEQEVERMAGLVGNLLQFSRAGREQVSTVDLTEELTRTAELCEHHLRKKGIRFESEYDPALPVIQADRQHLRQVFLNLFTNAADAMPAGGRLVSRARPSPLVAGTPGVVVEIADTGIGIPPDILPRVFEPFFTTKEEGRGTGLGLAICRRIVGEHGGRLEVESSPGTGTTFRIALPLRTETNVARLRS